MSNDTGTVTACQTQSHIPRLETTHPSLDSTDRRLVQRYGVALLTGGYTALPTYAWVYYARLGVSEAEMVLIAQLCTYWWSARDPYPGEAALAARMGKSVRTIQGYLRSLEGKGLLHIQTQFSDHGRQHTNAYDLRPFFAAVEGLARLDGLIPAIDADAPATTPTTAAARPQPQGTRTNDTCTTQSCDSHNSPNQDAERKSLCAGATSFGTENRPTDPIAPTMGEGEGSRGGGVKNPSSQVNSVEIENFDYDSIPPTPVNTRLGPTADDDPSDQALAQEIAVLSAELGDNAPASSVTRAANLRRDAGMSPARFLRLLDEAAARTRDRQASIVKRRRDGLAVNGMPYLFAVLADLLHPAPPQTRDVGPAADRQRTGPSRRRRPWRTDGRDEPATSYAAWSDSPSPLPITEEHPVWRAVLTDLAQVMTAENFNTWLATTRVVDQEGTVLRVAVATPFNKTWLEQKLAGKVASTLQKIDDVLDAALYTERVERVERVEYVVDAAACASTKATARAS